MNAGKIILCIIVFPVAFLITLGLFAGVMAVVTGAPFVIGIFSGLWASALGIWTIILFRDLWESM